MAPLIKTTIEILLGFTQLKAPSLQNEKPVHVSPHSYNHIHESYQALSPSISTISWGYNRLDVYALDTSGSIAHKYWDGYQWGPSVADLELLGGDSFGPPSAVSPNTSQMDIFASAKDGTIQHKYFDGSAWQPSVTGWDYLKSKVKGVPSVTSWAPGRLDAFFKGSDDPALHLVYYDGFSWGPKDSDDETLGGELASGPAAVSWGPNRNDVFAIDPSGNLIHQYWDGSNWSGFETFDFEPDFAANTPCAVSWGLNRLDVFVITTGGTLAHLYWDGFQWSALEDLGGESLTGTVAATASPNRFDIVALGEDGQYYYKLYDGSSWQPSVDTWYPKGGNFSSPPSVVSWLHDANQRFDIFGVTKGGELAHQTWYGSGWYPDYNEWETLGSGLAV